MNSLERYFSASGENIRKLADRMNVSPSTLTRPLKGERNASMDLALKVEEATGKRVSAGEFLEICLEAKRTFFGRQAAGSDTTEAGASE